MPCDGGFEPLRPKLEPKMGLVDRISTYERSFPQLQKFTQQIQHSEVVVRAAVCPAPKLAQPTVASTSAVFIFEATT